MAAERGEFIVEARGVQLASQSQPATRSPAQIVRMCMVHLLRELEQTLKYKSSEQDWPDFEKKLRRLLGDAIRLWKNRDERDAAAPQSRRSRFGKRLADLIDAEWEDSHAKRLVKRLARYQQSLFTFLDHDGVPFENNHAERSIRPAVILLENSYGNRSEQAADCQAVLMSIFRTLKQRGHDPIRTIITATTEYLRTRRMPPLPPKHTSIG